MTSTQILLHVHNSSIAIHLFRISEYHLLSCCRVDNSVTTYLLSLMLSKSDKNGSNWLKTESVHLHNDTYALWRHTTSTPDHIQDLKIGDHVLVQNQTGNQPTRWDKTGLVTEVLPHDQYLIRMDGSGQCTLRNRRYLRHCSPFMSDPREIVPTTPTSPVPIEKETEKPSTLPQPDGYTPNHDNQDFQKAVSPATHSTPPPDTSATPVAIQNLPF